MLLSPDQDDIYAYGDRDMVNSVIRNLMTNAVKFTDRDKQEVQGYYELLQNIFNAWRNIKFSENTIKHFHKELLKYTAKDAKHRGEYKKIENTVEAVNNQGKVIGIIFKTTLAYLAPKQTQELIEWTSEAFKEKKYHPLLIVGNFLVEFLKIHPFQDGNGRLSRVLTNLLLLKEGYLYAPYISHEKLVEDNKPEALHDNLKVLENVEYFIFTVTDNGRGIDEEDLKYIFEVGFSTKFDEETGDICRGVGLSLVKDIVENKLDGRIEVKSIKNVGTEFYVYVKRSKLGG